MIERLVFADQQWVHLVWLAVGLVALLGFLELRSRDGLRRFMSATMQARLARRQTLSRRMLKLGLILATLVLGVLGLMRPQTPGGTETLSSRRAVADIMVVLDVSNSMLAEDAAPNRLARAKAEIGEFISRVEGHRVGLVVFAGRGSVRSPLTSDYGFFRLALRDVDTRSVSLGGTRLGDAIRSAVSAFGPNRGAPRLMLLITDGEDHDSYPLEAVDEAVAVGVRIVAIGFGSEGGSEITLTDPDTGARSVLTDRDGNVVTSRLDGDLLREIALRSEGVYVPAGTSALDLDSIVEAYVEPLVTDSVTRVAQRSPTEHYRWFVLAALVSLVAAVWAGSSAGARGGEA
ncbi:VWA domain-containing protein [Candidatus Rariloculus sp.]|uniref:VWA domain-containing protein n=1 Tax=Candidatus Rariloculus sp. TaxID=3101265 RepID=UPI003D1111C5